MKKDEFDIEKDEFGHYIYMIKKSFKDFMSKHLRIFFETRKNKQTNKQTNKEERCV